VLKDKKLIQAVKKLSADSVPISGDSFRLVALRYQDSLLSTIGSFKRGGRYNIAQQFEALYVSGSPITALKEIRYLINTPAGVSAYPTRPYILLSLQYQLHRVMDLTDSHVRKILDTNVQELTGSWLASIEEGEIAPTQQLGKVAYDLGVQALKVPSSVDLENNGFNLVIFPENLPPNKLGFVEIYDPDGEFRQRLPQSG
jgi:RES domain-containing protein